MENTVNVVSSSPVSAAPRELTEAEIETLLANDPLLSAVGLYKSLWADEHADEYIARLRKDW